MAKPKTSPLPPIVFGQLRSKIDMDLLQMRDRVNSITNWVSEYDILDASHAFQHRTSVFACNGVRVIAVSSTPTVMKVNDPDCTIAIAMTGHLETWVGGQHFKYGDQRQAMFYPAGKRHTEGGVKSTLLISVSSSRLLESARVMLSEEGIDQIDIQTARLLETTHGNVDLLKVIQQACITVDQFHGNLELLRNFSPDEHIVRAVVMMLAPDHFFSTEAMAGKIEQPRKLVLNHLCDYIVGNLDQPLNLTRLELVSGLSARMLQMEFKKRYASTPMQWVREQRLLRARQVLRFPRLTTTVSAVAADCGFDNFSDFARRYATLFGELPSETLKKGLSIA